VAIWSADTPSPHNNINDSSQLGSPSNTFVMTGPNNVSPFGGFAGGSNTAINFSLGSQAAASSIGAFLAADAGGTMTLTNCGVPCQGTNLSGPQGSFSHVSLFEFRFTIATGGSLLVTHDDGASLFLDSGGNPTGSNLLVQNGAHASDFPTTSEQNTAPALVAGTYDLFYAADNGLPEILQTDFTASPPPPPPPVPEPASLALFGTGLLLVASAGAQAKVT